MEGKKVHGKRSRAGRRGELIALDISKSLNELREQCMNGDEIYNVLLNLKFLKKKVNDEDSAEQIETMCKILSLESDPFRKMDEVHKKRILTLCKYIEGTYLNGVIRDIGNEGEETGGSFRSKGDRDLAPGNVIVTGDGNVVATGGGVAKTVVNINRKTGN